ncbi:monofunctional biosynthetic peptidoglycan transglycosylase [Methylomonas sp. 2BW1-5-20]|uniref:monofunctional biosynthetic peptidoglycan transglycosylase n=1 Tax=Methylomonas sp. 2BW1-5-20 TaxID=3376686 RepID=UPI00404F37C7
MDNKNPSHNARTSVKHFRHPARYRQFSRQSKSAMSLLQLCKRGLTYVLLFFVLSSLLLVGALRYLPAPTSAFMLHQHIDDLAEGKPYKGIDQRWVSRLHISPHAFAAVIASEDQLFYQHNGFDVDAIAKAFNQYLRGGKLRGASTISQQVAKNLFLSPAKNFGRKALEIWFTLLIETVWDKQRILEMYLNIAEFGDHLFGIEAASRRYFGVSAQQLSPNQAALLAATLPNPILLKADQPSAYLHKRQSWILGQMRTVGN